MRLTYSCLLLLTALFASRAGAARGMTFTLTRAGPCEARTCVYADGPVEISTAGAFKAFVQQQGLPEGTLVLLNSDGGNHLAGIALGAELRRLSLDTEVAALDQRTRRLRPGTCSSACVYAFMGGMRRAVPERSRIGVHQVVIPETMSSRASISDAQWLMGLAAIHLQRMGATPDVMALALTTRPHLLRWLTPAELTQFDVVTHNIDTGRFNP